eukprot:gene19677-6846_t
MATAAPQPRAPSIKIGNMLRTLEAERPTQVQKLETVSSKLQTKSDNDHFRQRIDKERK